MLARPTAPTGRRVCFISPLAPERGGSVSADRTTTATPGTRIDLVMCSYVFSEQCSQPYFSPVGAEIGTVSGTTITGTTVYRPIGIGGGATVLGTSGLETQIGPLGFSPGLLVRPVVNDSRPVGYTGLVGASSAPCQTGPGGGDVYVNGSPTTVAGSGFTKGTQYADADGVRTFGTRVCTPAGNFGSGNGWTGVLVAPGLGTITPQSDLNPEGGVGARWCGHNATIYNDGEVVHSQPLDVGAGSMSC